MYLMLCYALTIFSKAMGSYNKEQACGDPHNIIMVAMSQFQMDAQTAIYWAVDFHANLHQQFCEAYQQIPRWEGPLDLEVQAYVDALANWVRGNFQWMFECERYLGKQGQEIMKSRRVPLLPKKAET